TARREEPRDAVPSYDLPARARRRAEIGAGRNRAGGDREDREGEDDAAHRLRRRSGSSCESKRNAPWRPRGASTAGGVSLLRGGGGRRLRRSLTGVVPVMADALGRLLG